MAAEVNKPDFSFQWASGGAIVAPSDVKIQTGWTAEVPPFQWENYLQNRQDNGLLHLFQKGISEWDAASNYYFTTSGVRSYVQGSNGTIYVAVADSLNQDPVTDTSNTYWKKAFASPEDNLLRAGVIGSVRNLKMTVLTAAATSTVTADEIIVKTALGGNSYTLTSFNKTINLANTGVGGMDTGIAPVNGYVGIYAIYNPTTQVSGLLVVNGTSIILPEIYGGANMPAGYTASALLTVVPTNASSQFKVCSVIDRVVTIILVTVFSSGLNTPLTPISLAAAIPPNGKKIFGELQLVTTSGPANVTLSITSNSTLLGQQNISLNTAGSGIAGAGGTTGNYANVPILVPQTASVTASTSAGTPTFTAYVGGYEV